MTQRIVPAHLRAESVRLPAGSRPLCLFCGPGLDEPGPVAGLLGRMWGSGGLLGGTEGLIRFYANPRGAAMLADLAQEAVAQATSGGAMALADPTLPDIREAAKGFAEVTEADPSTPDGARLICERLARPDWDVALLVFPDAIGLGAGAMQRLALSDGRPVYVLNGRRRLFLLDGATRRALAWRRFLVRSRVTEKLLAVLAYAVGAVLLAPGRNAK